MKFSWKVFFSTVIVTLVSFSIGGYILISALFSTSLEREVTAAYQENSVLYSSLGHSIATLPHNGALSDGAMKKLAASLQITTANGVLPFQISGETFMPLFSNRTDFVKTELPRGLSPNTRGYTTIRENESYTLAVCSPLTENGQVFYLETFRDITPLYIAKEEQFLIFRRILLLLALVISVLIFSIALWLTHPLKVLSVATKRIAQGDLHSRLKIAGTDEVAMLTKDFNLMTEKLEQTVLELKDAARRQEDFVAGFAHELKTPLTSIIGYADMLRSKRMNEEQRFEAANFIFSEGKRLESLSFKLLELIVLKKQDFILRKVSASVLFEAVETVIRPVFQEKEIICSFSVEEAVLEVEPDLIQTVCLNLLDNARKAVGVGGMIIVTGKNDGIEYQVSIRDNGQGIPPQELARITEAFYMVDKSRARAQGGAGLGLSLCAEIMALHGGTLSFDSEEGVGTTATITLKGGEAVCGG